MSTAFDEVVADYQELQALAQKRLVDDPLPRTEAEARERLAADIDKYDLAKHVVELDINGYTVLPPDKAAPIEFFDRLREAIERVDAERRAADDVSSIERSGRDLGAGKPAFHLMAEDPVFQEAVCNPVVLTLVTYLAGFRARMHTTTGLIKTNESDVPLYWHTDTGRRIPMPWPQQSLGANVNWITTPYSRENGALCVAPGSHALCRPPDVDMTHDDPRCKLIECPAGSVAVWHYNLWHAAVPRTAEGRRVTYVTSYDRPHLQLGDAYPHTTTREMLERNPARFGHLMGLMSTGMARSEGPDLSIFGMVPGDFVRWA